jgi:cell volume regulation protein A
MPSLEIILITTAVLLLLSILASKAAVRLGIPALLLFLCLGMLAGSEGIGGIEFDYPRLAQSFGIVALVFILFSAALDTKWDQIRPVLGSGVSLATLGVVISSVMMALFATQFIGLRFRGGLLLGAVVSSTDAAAVFTVLRSKNLTLKGRLREVAELESGSNDPMAVLLTIGMLSLFSDPRRSIWSLIPLFLLQLGVGAALGFFSGRAMRWLINRIRLEWEGLYPVLSVAFVLAIYGITTLARGSGFLAIYIAGLVLGNATFTHRRTLMLFHDGLAWLMQIAMFVVLGLQVFPSRLVPVAPFGLLTAAFLMFVARPTSVFVALSCTAFTWREKLFLSWAGLRGAVPIILATFPLVAGVANAELLFNFVFFITLTSVLLQGTTISTVAKWMKVLGSPRKKRAYPIEYNPAAGIKSELVEIEISTDSQAAGKRIVELGLPKDVLIVLMGRGDELIVPSGSTVVMPGDTLLVLGEKEPVSAIRVQLTSHEA